MWNFLSVFLVFWRWIESDSICGVVLVGFVVLFVQDYDDWDEVRLRKRHLSKVLIHCHFTPRQQWGAVLCEWTSGGKAKSDSGHYLWLSAEREWTLISVCTSPKLENKKNVYIYYFLIFFHRFFFLFQFFTSGWLLKWTIVYI